MILFQTVLCKSWIFRLIILILISAFTELNSSMSEATTDVFISRVNVAEDMLNLYKNTEVVYYWNA